MVPPLGGVRVCIDMITKHPYRLHINNSIEHHFLDVDNILYFKSNGNYTNVLLCDGTEILNIPKQLGQIARVINNTMPSELRGALVQVGRYYIVNTTHIKTIHISKRLLVFDARPSVNMPSVISPSAEALLQLCSIMSETYSTSTHYPTSVNEDDNDWDEYHFLCDDAVCVLGKN